MRLYRLFIGLVFVFSVIVFVIVVDVRRVTDRTLFTDGEINTNDLLEVSSQPEMQATSNVFPVLDPLLAVDINSDSPSAGNAVRKNPRRRRRQKQRHLEQPLQPDSSKRPEQQQQQQQDILHQLETASGSDQAPHSAASNQSRSHFVISQPPHEQLRLTATQRRRLDLVEATCRRRKASGAEPDWGLYFGDNMFFNDKLRVVYCLVPKVACTTWTRVLLVSYGGPYLGKTANDLPQSAANSERLDGDILISLSEYRPEEVAYRLQNYFKFMFVRHPYERLVSAYRDRLHSNHKLAKNLIGKHIVQHYRRPPNETRSIEKKQPHGSHYDPRTTPTFPEFVEYLIDPATTLDEPFNAHWRPQFELCHPCAVNYDFIGHFETMNDDARYVLGRLGVADRVSFPHKDPDNARTIKSAQLVEQMFRPVPNEHMNKLYAVYRDDFEFFNFTQTRSISLA